MVEAISDTKTHSAIAGKVRIILADDHPMMRQSIRLWLEKEQDLQVVAEARDGKEAVEVTAKLHPDILILDISMPKMNGLEVTKQIVARCPHTDILVLSVHGDDEHISGMLKAGASGYLTKDVSGEDVVHAVRSIISGENVFPLTSTPDYENKYLSGTDLLFQNMSDDLNFRELRILKLVAKGMSNKGIASNLGMNVRNVKANLTDIFLKLHVSSRTEAVSLGLKKGIISLKDLD
jgi:two-component system, NarL family, response regulator LiaR